MRTWVRSLALLGGLRIQCCHEPWCRSQMQLDSSVVVAVAGSFSSNSTPSLGTHEAPPKKTKNNNVF